jgi:hydrocephalus-inducing protein
MTGIIHLSVINNQYEETIIHLVGEGYKDDITLDNIHGLAVSTSQEASDISEVIEIAEENAVENLVAGRISSSKVSTTIGSWVILSKSEM